MDLELAQRAPTALLNLALAVAVGAGATSLWLAPLASGWAALQRRRLRRAGVIATVAAMLASACLLWLKAAAMGEVALTQAGEATWSLLTATHFGVAWMIGIGALGVSLLARRLTLVGLSAFLFTRSMVSHAAGDGDFTLAVFVDWLHLNLICLWVGEVLLSGFLVLAKPAGDRADCAAYVESLSLSATIALGGIFATGLFSAWHHLGGLAALTGSAYGLTLAVKVALVLAAAILGGFNRFFVMPKLIAGGSDVGRFTFVLRVEAAVLLGVLALAAVLSSTAPPTAG